jgi:hypothetical protein
MVAGKEVLRIHCHKERWFFNSHHAQEGMVMTYPITAPAMAVKWKAFGSY